MLQFTCGVSTITRGSGPIVVAAEIRFRRSSMKRFLLDDDIFEIILDGIPSPIFIVDNDARFTHSICPDCAKDLYPF